MRLRARTPSPAPRTHAFLTCTARIESFFLGLSQAPRSAKQESSRPPGGFAQCLGLIDPSTKCSTLLNCTSDDQRARAMYRGGEAGEPSAGAAGWELLAGVTKAHRWSISAISAGAVHTTTATGVRDQRRIEVLRCARRSRVCARVASSSRCGGHERGGGEHHRVLCSCSCAVCHRARASSGHQARCDCGQRKRRSGDAHGIEPLGPLGSSESCSSLPLCRCACRCGGR